jgi:hypothetical protein
MSKDSVEKVADSVKKTVDNTKDAIHEGQHRAAADAEKSRRETSGDEMTPGERARSTFEEAKHRVQAKVDETKRDLRNKT